MLFGSTYERKVFAELLKDHSEKDREWMATLHLHDCHHPWLKLLEDTPTVDVVLTNEMRNWEFAKFVEDLKTYSRMRLLLHMKDIPWIE